MEKGKVNKTKTLKIVTILAISATLSLGAYMYSAKNVVLNVDGREEKVTTFSNTVEELLKEKGIFVDEYSYINLPLETELEDNLNIIIKLAKPYILSYDGVQCEVVSIHNKVEDILKEQKIELNDDDYTYPALDEKLNPLDEIKIFKVEKIVEEIEEVTPFQSLVKKTDELDIGQERTIQEGENGLKKIKIMKVYENGKLIDEKTVDEIIVKEAVPEIVERGTKNVLTASRGTFRYKQVMIMEATAYDLSYESTGKMPGDKWYGITASGTQARVGAVAVDPNVIPLGTKLYVESLDGTPDYGFCTAEDTGSAIKGYRIDLFFNTAEEVKNFGRRKVKVYILDND